MKKFRYILILLLMVGITMAINGGIKSRPAVRKTKASVMFDKAMHGIPDLITFTNYINQ